MHDIIGHYNRFDIFNLQVNRRSQQPVQWHDGDAGLQSIPPADDALEDEPESAAGRDTQETHRR
jgi:nitrilase